MGIMFLKTENPTLDMAFRLALGDIATNIKLHQAGLLEDPSPILSAGLDYPVPWVRDSAINIWNGSSLLYPHILENNLKSVLARDNNRLVVSADEQYGQYWDIIIWVIGAWWHYVFTGDKAFLQLAYEVACNTMTHCEATQFDTEMHLFRGPAVFADGVSAYPDTYTNNGGSSGILEWRDHNTEHDGIPMFAFSTNCVFYEAYRLISRMAIELGKKPSYEHQAQRLKATINLHFWKSNAYQYLIDPFGGCDYQEGIGHAFALLFGIADDAQTKLVLKNQHITPAGIPCLWPTFPRYQKGNPNAFGRHSGTVWPHVQALWAHAAALAGHDEMFMLELQKLAEHAIRDEQFAEIYHPETGKIYGGEQEGGEGLETYHGGWKSCSRETWSATGFLRMILMGLVGMRFEPEGIYFKPIAAPVRLNHLLYRDIELNIVVEGSGTRTFAKSINERETPR